MAAEDVSKPEDLPPYSEMILAAISALNEKDGASKAEISKYMESTYKEELLPSSHSSMLTAALVGMKESGELIMVKNNYLPPGLDATPKRGRGRPPKPKTPIPVSPGRAPSTPRSRGRPPKAKDPLAAAIAKAAMGLPKRRGRPPGAVTKVRPAGGPPATAAGSGGSLKRGRGRPPKVRPPVADVAA